MVIFIKLYVGSSFYFARQIIYFCLKVMYDNSKCYKYFNEQCKNFFDEVEDEFIKDC